MKLPDRPVSFRESESLEGDCYRGGKLTRELNRPGAVLSITVVATALCRRGALRNQGVPSIRRQSGVATAKPRFARVCGRSRRECVSGDGETLGWLRRIRRR